MNIIEAMERRTGVRRVCPMIICLVLCLIPDAVRGQDLFESVTAGDEDKGEAKYQLSGYLRSGIFSGTSRIRDAYAEGSLDLDIVGDQYGDAFTEIRCRAASQKSENECSLREGYVNLYLGKWDFRLGKQVVAWGRADGFNPTNNITSTDFTLFSPDEDDKKLSNFVVRSVYNASPFRLEIDWIPVYLPSALPFENAAMPEGVKWSGYIDPSTKLGNSSLGVKADLELPGFDGSISYYRGFYKNPGITYSVLEEEIGVYAQPYRVQILGSDFSTALKRYGFRGEFAWSIPDDSHDRLFSIPYRQLEYTLGIDREWNDFSLILQYIGKHVYDFDQEAESLSVFEEEIVKWNRMIFAQQKEWSHSVSARPALNLLHETLKCEALGLVNLSTKEVFIQPKAAYHLSDDLIIAVGEQLFWGPDDTLYGFMGKKRNAVFAEAKLFF